MNLRYLNLDFAGRRALAASEHEADAAIEEWQLYSHQLKAKLADAEKQAAYSAAREAGRDAQQKALRTALQALEPNHPLLKVLPDIGGKAMVESFAARGYHYDLATETVRKL